MLFLTEESQSDWIELGEVDPGGSVQVDLSFLHLEGDIDLELYSSNEVLLDSSESVLDTESITWTNQGVNTRTYFAKVLWYAGECRQAYEVDFVIF